MPPEMPLESACACVSRQWSQAPAAAIVLGSGMGALAEQIEIQAEIPYCEIPGFQRSTAIGHRGRLVCGELAGLPVVAMDGRVHGFEGYSLHDVTFPIRVMCRLGAPLLVVTNAAGGLNPQYRPGDIMVIEDHINLLWRRPLASAACDIEHPRTPSLCQPYDPALVDRALAIARQKNFTAHRGVYVGVQGPNYETRAEYRMLRRIGADAVGMSTVPEVIVAAQMGVRVLGLSIIANVGLPDAPHKTTGEEVVAAVAAAEPKARSIVLGVLAQEGRI